MRGPEFILAGGHKCATTTLHALLSRHPGVAASTVKEPHYLARRALQHRLHEGVWSENTYQGLWPTADTGLRGESSVLYLSFAEDVTRSIHENLDAPPKIVVSLRNPVNRALSSFIDGQLTSPDETARTFREAVDREIARGPHRLDGEDIPTLRHLALGMYSSGIATFFEAFGRDSVHVMLFEEFKENPEAVWQDLLLFLGLSPIGIPEQEALNTGGLAWKGGMVSHVARSRTAVAARRLTRKVSPSAHARLRRTALARLTGQAESMDGDTRLLLSEFYEPELVRLETLLGCSLDRWRTRA